MARISNQVSLARSLAPSRRLAPSLPPAASLRSRLHALASATARPSRSPYTPAAIARLLRSGCVADAASGLRAEFAAALHHARRCAAPRCNMLCRVATRCPLRRAAVDWKHRRSLVGPIAPRAQGGPPARPTRPLAFRHRRVLGAPAGVAWRAWRACGDGCAFSASARPPLPPPRGAPRTCGPRTHARTHAGGTEDYKGRPPRDARLSSTAVGAALTFERGWVHSRAVAVVCRSTTASSRRRRTTTCAMRSARHRAAAGAAPCTDELAVAAPACAVPHAAHSMLPQCCRVTGACPAQPSPAQPSPAQPSPVRCTWQRWAQS